MILYIFYYKILSQVNQLDRRLSSGYEGRYKYKKSFEELIEENGSLAELANNEVSFFN